MELKTEFIKWIEKKTNKPFPIVDKLLLAFLDQSIEDFENFKLKGMNIHLNQNPQEFSLGLLKDWISVARLFLELRDTGVSLNFRKSQIPQDEQRRLALLNQLILLENECL